MGYTMSMIKFRRLGDSNSVYTPAPVQGKDLHSVILQI